MSRSGRTMEAMLYAYSEAILAARLKPLWKQSRCISRRDYFYNMDDLQLIELVRKHSFLYDAKSVSYKDTIIRENVWTEISNAMNQPGE